MNRDLDLNNLAAAIGKKLNKVLGLALQSTYQSRSATQEIFLKFEDQCCVRLFCGSDGSSICWDSNHIQSFSMGEYGDMLVFDLSETNILWKNLINASLTKVHLIESQVEESIFAVQFTFSQNLRLVVANLGDEMVFQNQLSTEVLEGEKANFLEIQV